MKEKCTASSRTLYFACELAHAPLGVEVAVNAFEEFSEELFGSIKCAGGTVTV